MLGWTLTFLLAVLIVIFLELGGAAAVSAGLAKIVFNLFLTALVISLLIGRGGSAA